MLWYIFHFCIIALILKNCNDLYNSTDLSQVSQMICGCYKLIQTGDEVGLKARLDSLPQPAVQNSVLTHVNQEVEVNAL